MLTAAQLAQLRQHAQDKETEAHKQSLIQSLSHQEAGPTTYSGPDRWDVGEIGRQGRAGAMGGGVLGGGIGLITGGPKLGLAGAAAGTVGGGLLGVGLEGLRQFSPSARQEVDSVMDSWDVLVQQTGRQVPHPMLKGLAMGMAVDWAAVERRLGKHLSKLSGVVERLSTLYEKQGKNTDTLYDDVAKFVMDSPIEKPAEALRAAEATLGRAAGADIGLDPMQRIAPTLTKETRSGAQVNLLQQASRTDTTPLDTVLAAEQETRLLGGEAAEVSARVYNAAKALLSGQAAASDVTPQELAAAQRLIAESQGPYKSGALANLGSLTETLLDRGQRLVSLRQDAAKTSTYLKDEATRRPLTATEQAQLSRAESLLASSMSTPQSGMRTNIYNAYQEAGVHPATVRAKGLQHPDALINWITNPSPTNIGQMKAVFKRRLPFNKGEALLRQVDPELGPIAARYVYGNSSPSAFLKNYPQIESTQLFNILNKALGQMGGTVPIPKSQSQLDPTTIDKLRKKVALHNPPHRQPVQRGADGKALSKEETDLLEWFKKLEFGGK